MLVLLITMKHKTIMMTFLINQRCQKMEEEQIQIIIQQLEQLLDQVVRTRQQIEKLLQQYPRKESTFPKIEPA